MFSSPRVASVAAVLLLAALQAASTLHAQPDGGIFDFESDARPARKSPDVRVFKLKYASAAEVVESLRNTIGQASPAAISIAGSSSNSIIAAGPEETVQMIGDTIREIDQATTDRAEEHVVVRFQLLGKASPELADYANRQLTRLNPGTSVKIQSDANDLWLTASGPRAEIEQFQPILASYFSSKQNSDGPDRQLKIFALRYLQASDAASAISQVIGEEASRVAVDERTNSLLVNGEPEVLAVVEAILQNLDVAESEGTPDEKPAAATSRRIAVYWLATGNGFMSQHNMPESLTPVLEELESLGMEDLQLVTQSIAAFDGAEFTVQSRVQLAGREFEFQAQGEQQSSEVAGSAAIDFDLSASELLPSLIAQDSEEEPVQAALRELKRVHSRSSLGEAAAAQVSATVSAPAGHFVVIGATGLADLQCAFVVQIQEVE